jgi:hypothetical protein
MGRLTQRRRMQRLRPRVRENRRAKLRTNMAQLRQPVQTQKRRFGVRRLYVSDEGDLAINRHNRRWLPGLRIGMPWLNVLISA